MSIIKAHLNYDLEMVIKGKYSLKIGIYENNESRKIRPYSKRDYTLYKELIYDKNSTFMFEWLEIDTYNDILRVTIQNPNYNKFSFEFVGASVEWWFNRYLSDYESWIDFKPEDEGTYEFKRILC